MTLLMAFLNVPQIQVMFFMTAMLGFMDYIINVKEIEEYNARYVHKIKLPIIRHIGGGVSLAIMVICLIEWASK